MNDFKIISFHPGRQHNFEQASQVYKFFKSFKHLTSLYFDPSTVNYFSKISPKIAAGLKKRSGNLRSKIVDTNPYAEAQLLLKKKMGHKLTYSDFVKRNASFQNWLLRKYSPPKICIGFDTSSWIVFEKWKNKSFLILDLSIAVPQYKRHLAAQSNMSSTIQDKLTQGDTVFYDIYEQELSLADLILCGSQFVKQSCLSLGVDSNKLVVVPYGTDLTKFVGNSPNQKSDKEKIKIVFIGSVGYRKGADIVFEAWKKIVNIYTNVELHFYGQVEIETFENLDRIYFHGFITQDYLIAELQGADISILPTFFEGSSLAIYQSMAMGLAVITTPNAGSIVDHKINGLLINYGSVNELVNALELLIKDKALRVSLATKASQDIQHYTWDDYGDRMYGLLNNILEGSLSKINGINV